MDAFGEASPAQVNSGLPQGAGQAQILDELLQRIGRGHFDGGGVVPRLLDDALDHAAEIGSLRWRQLRFRVPCAQFRGFEFRDPGPAKVAHLQMGGNDHAQPGRQLAPREVSQHFLRRMMDN